MKKILFICLLLVASVANAQPSATRLIGLGMPAELSKEVAKLNSATGDVVPAADSTYDIGSASSAYTVGYFDAVQIEGDASFADGAGANTACATTCTTGCLFGLDAATPALVDCADATADSCICSAS